MDRTPRNGQRLLFSATLDNAIDVLVKRFLNSPVTHEADSAQSPISTMDHHVLHVAREHRVPVLVDLTSAPGRTVVFTRTKHGAKALTRQLNKNGVPTVELHGNLSQNARTRNMEAFHSGKATTLVATDIAARGIHVDDVALVVHADPPVEHKAYLHRSGRTARAGAEGTVITLMTDEQVRDVRDLTRAAGIKPTTTKIDGASHPILAQLAPGERVLVPGGLGRRGAPPAPAAAVRRAAVAPAAAVAVAPVAAAARPVSAAPAAQRGPVGPAVAVAVRQQARCRRRQSRVARRVAVARVAAARPPPRPAVAHSRGQLQLRSPLTRLPVRLAAKGVTRCETWSADAALWDVVPRDQQDSPRRCAAARSSPSPFLVLGGVVLGFSLRIEPGSPWFYPADAGAGRDLDASVRSLPARCTWAGSPTPAASAVRWSHRS